MIFNIRGEGIRQTIRASRRVEHPNVYILRVALIKVPGEINNCVHPTLFIPPREFRRTDLSSLAIYRPSLLRYDVRGVVRYS